MDIQAAEQAIHGALASHPEVRLAYLFGSRVHGSTGPLSDYDVAVLLDRDHASHEAGFALAHELRMVLDADVDLVLLNHAAIALAYAVIAQGRLLLESDVATRVDFEAHVLSTYGDYLPVLRRQRRDLLHGDCHAARVRRNRGAAGRVTDAPATSGHTAREKPG